VFLRVWCAWVLHVVLTCGAFTVPGYNLEVLVARVFTITTGLVVTRVASATLCQQRALFPSGFVAGVRVVSGLEP
jgi:hypothetical protein